MTKKPHTYKLVVYNGRVKIYIDGYVMVSFNQIEYRGMYSYKDDTDLYGIDFYLTAGVVIETSYKTKEVWLSVLKLLDERL